MIEMYIPQSVYTQKRVHPKVCKSRSAYTQKRAHPEACTPGSAPHASTIGVEENIKTVAEKVIE